MRKSVNRPIEMLILATIALFGFASCSKGDDDEVTVTNPTSPAIVSPSKYLATVQSGTSLVLDWSDATVTDGSAITYDLYFGQNSLPSTATASGLTTSQYTIAGDELAAGEDFQWKVIAKTAAGGVASSSTWTFYTTGPVADYSTRIPDSNLRAAIASQLAIDWGTITHADLAGIEDFSYPNLDTDPTIADLTGIQYCHGLMYLYLCGNSFSSIDALASLDQLVSLYLGDNSLTNANVTNVVTLGNMPNLTTLDLTGDSVMTAAEGIAIANRFPALTNIRLRRFHLTDTQLTTLISGRQSLLKELKIPRSDITDTSLTALNSFSKLKKLDIAYATSITSTALAASATSADWKGQLIYLRIQGCSGITDIGFLTTLRGYGSFPDSDSEIAMTELANVIISSAAAEGDDGYSNYQIIKPFLDAGVTVGYDDAGS